jgi:hypothetical protein
MTDRQTSRAAWVLLAIVTGVGGYALGSRHIHKTMIGALQTEAAGNLSQRIEALSLLRMNDAPGAIDRLEREADLLARTIAQNPGADRQVLAYMKTYLSVAPPSPDRARALSPALQDVPILQPGKCQTALKALLLASKGGAAAGGANK